jgi:hypothetical protein
MKLIPVEPESSPLVVDGPMVDGPMVAVPVVSGGSIPDPPGEELPPVLAPELDPVESGSSNPQVQRLRSNAVA